jgi:signal transduction histidine kinase
VGGLVAAGVVAAVGTVVEWWRLGRADEEAVARLERAVRERVLHDAARLQAAATRLAAHPEVVAALAGGEDRATALFDLLDSVLADGRDDLAATIYSATGAVLAWYGRPGEIAPERVAAGTAIFAATDPRNLRLVAQAPVVATEPVGSRAPRRLGVVAVERTLATRRPAGGTDGFLLETAPIPVSLLVDPVPPSERDDLIEFDVTGADGGRLLTARASWSALVEARRRLRHQVRAWALSVLAATLVLLMGPLLDRRARVRSAAHYLAGLAGLLALLLAARSVLLVAWSGGSASTAGWSPTSYRALPLGPLVRSPIDLLLTALAAVAGVALGADGVARWRLRWSRRRKSPTGPSATAAFLVVQAGAGLLAGWLARGDAVVLAESVAHTSFDPLYFSLHPWQSARLAWLAGLVAAHVAAAWSLALLLLAAWTPWRIASGKIALRALALGLWLAGGAVGLGTGEPVAGPWVRASLLGLIGGAGLVALAARGGLARYRHGSSAARLSALFVAVLAPALLLYPALAELAHEAKHRLVEAHYAPQALHYRDELQIRLAAALKTIDGLTELMAQVTTQPVQSDAVDADAAFVIWRRTELAIARLTSAIELYDANGRLLSRFALNFPEYAAGERRWRGHRCEWEVFGEVVTQGAQPRQVLHAERAVCASADGRRAGQPAGGIVVHAMLDYRALPFLSSQSPYVELFRAGQMPPQEGAPGRDIELVIYGWALVPLFASTGDAWVIDEGTFARIRASRTPFWTVLSRNGRAYHAYVANDRAGIYVVGYPLLRPTTHLVHLGELAALVGAGFVAAALGMAVFARLARSSGAGRALLREIRASFYRRLFLAFVFAAVLPAVIPAAVIRTYFASRLRADVEASATRTALVAQRVIEEALALQQRAGQVALSLTDDVLVWIGQIIDQGVNIFDGPRLVATSERDLFASGLLSPRTPAEVYRAIVVQRLPSFVGEDRVGDVRYLLAAAPVRTIDRHAILTVPLLPRQQEIEREIDELDRGILLGALLFVLLGAGLGYGMAQRIADPVSRLTRATRRIARGDFDAHLTARTSDELGSLLAAFNGMAAELKAQREKLERTHRLEAWAEMARQVAHEIKNPLTPIQLSAEHLLRVHADRGEPLSPVLERCIDAILTQVRLLRQIAAEFSSFASAPTAQPVPTAVADLIAEVLEPYRSGLGERIVLDVRVSPTLPLVQVDRVLLARALTNIIENALHAMPGGGRLTVEAAQVDDRVLIRVTDTGVGMDEAALRRAFEPYFSTKASGTGLGLAIAKRNVELNGGTIEIASEKGRGTTVTLTVRAIEPREGGSRQPPAGPAPPADSGAAPAREASPPVPTPDTGTPSATARAAGAWQWQPGLRLSG